MAFKDLPDQLLLEKCRQDDKAAYEVLFERYFRRLYNFTLHYVKDSFVAEELVMDLMLTIWKRRYDLNLQGELLTYLFSAMKNTVISHARKKNLVTTRIDMMGDEHLSLSRSADYNLYSTELENIYRQKLEKLSPQRRQVFELSRFEHKTYPEIAAQLNLSLHTVRNHISASLQHFREHLEKYVDATLVVFALVFLHK